MIHMQSTCACVCTFAASAAYPQDSQAAAGLIGWAFSLGGIAFDLGIVVPLLLSTELNRSASSRKHWRCKPSSFPFGSCSNTQPARIIRGRRRSILADCSSTLASAQRVRASESKYSSWRGLLLLCDGNFHDLQGTCLVGSD